MEPFAFMLIGAAGVVWLLLVRLAARHGWAWIEARLACRAGRRDTAETAREVRIHNVTAQKLGCWK